MRGEVSWFDDSKGYGFLKPASGGKDVFVHYTAIEEGPTVGLKGERRTLKAGQQVEYEVVNGPKGPQAAGVRVVDAGAG